MRVLIAYDGSQGAEQGLSLATTLAWPPDSKLELVVVEPFIALCLRNPLPRALACGPPTAVGLGEGVDRRGHRRDKALLPPRLHRAVRHFYQLAHIGYERAQRFQRAQWPSFTER